MTLTPIMKLKLKHLSAYLPYGLKIKSIATGEIVELSCVTDTSVNIKDRNFQYGMWGDIFDIQPIFRPISDLINLMPNNDVCYISYMWYEIIGADSDSFDKDTFFDQCEIGNISFLPAMVIPKLLEWHFDVFGLIDAGLAIDINTLNK